MAKAKKPATRRKARDVKEGAGPPKGWALNIGLNAVNPKHYGGWEGTLRAAEADATQMQVLATTNGMVAKMLLAENATRAKVLAEIKSAANTLTAGDLFLITFAGNGGQLPDVSGEELSRQSETWCLHDAQMIDDELYGELTRFRANVRIIIVSDTCHSGTVTRAVPSSFTDARLDSRSRLMPPAVAFRTYREHQSFYDRLQMDLSRAAGRHRPASGRETMVLLGARADALVDTVAARVILVSACQDNQMAQETEESGVFTATLLRIWNDGRFQGNHTTFFARVRAMMPATQTPAIRTIGKPAAFFALRPFTV